MSVTGNSVFPLPEAAAADLCKRLGLALGNAAMYGMVHTVTVNAQNAAYESGWGWRWGMPPCTAWCIR